MHSDQAKLTPKIPIIGHWSTLGLVNNANLIALDTGCLWGSRLTAVRLEDRQVFSVKCPQLRKPR